MNVTGTSIRPILSAARRGLLCLLAALGLLAAASPAQAQIAIGFCQGRPGSFDSFTISFLICCPGDLVPTRVTATTAVVDCSDAGAVMGAVNAAVGGMMFGGAPIFGPPVAVPSPIGGQARYEYPLSGPFAASGCCIVGGSVSFRCGTMSLRINPPCGKPGFPPGDGRPVKLCLDSPPPPFPTTLAIKLEGCPIIFVPLDGTESAAVVRGKVLAALAAAGYTAFLNPDDKVEITGDCTGGLPTGVDEFGLVGGHPMDLGIEICPPPEEPTPYEPTTWGRVKSLYRG